jgi:micrococcal nuclease
MQRAGTLFFAAACWVFCSLLLAVALFFATPGLAQTSQTVTVERVVDGDTIEVSPAVQGKEAVRLIGVDTPETVDPEEPVEPLGPEASTFTKEQLEGKQVTLTFDEEKTDPFDRALAYVGVDGEIFNETLLEQGYAQLYIVSPNDRYEAQFREAQDQARQAHRGIWELPVEQQCELANRGNAIGEGSPGCEEGTTTSGTTTSGTNMDKNCSNFPNQAGAQAELRSNPEDPFGLDGPIGRSSIGIPGVACEGNPPPKDLTPAPGYGEISSPTTPRPGTPHPQKPKKLPPTGGPSYLLLGTLALLGTALVVARGGLRR